MLQKTLFGLLLAGLAAAGTGCGGSQPGTVNPQASAYVEVQNQNFLDMTVYVVRSGQRYRLGTVTGNSTQVFEIPRGFVNPGLPVRFQADPIGSQVAPFSQEIPVWPGDTIVLRIPP